MLWVANQDCERQSREAEKLSQPATSLRPEAIYNHLRPLFSNEIRRPREPEERALMTKQTFREPTASAAVASS
jgi:hypothetical protein